MIKVKLKKLDQKAVLPTKATSKDFCYDVVAVSEEEIAPNIWRYGLGFAFEIERNWEKFGLGELRDRENFVLPKAYGEFSLNLSDTPINLSLDFRPRSSVWKTGMILSNCEGTLDELYRGEVMAVFYHIYPNLPRYKIGDRIGQIKLGLTLPLEFEFVDEIDMNTDRGTGGFGSTGK